MKLVIIFKYVIPIDHNRLFSAGLFPKVSGNLLALVHILLAERYKFQDAILSVPWTNASAMCWPGIVANI